MAVYDPVIGHPFRIAYAVTPRHPENIVYI